MENPVLRVCLCGCRSPGHFPFRTPSPHQKGTHFVVLGVQIWAPVVKIVRSYRDLECQQAMTRDSFHAGPKRLSRRVRKYGIYGVFRLSPIAPTPESVRSTNFPNRCLFQWLRRGPRRVSRPILPPVDASFDGERSSWTPATGVPFSSWPNNPRSPAALTPDSYSPVSSRRSAPRSWAAIGSPRSLALSDGSATRRRGWPSRSPTGAVGAFWRRRLTSGRPPFTAR